MDKCNQNKTLFSLFYVRTGALKRVSKERFSSLKGTVHTFHQGQLKIRVIGECPKNRARELLRNSADSFFHAQAVPGWSMIQDLINKITRVTSFVRATGDKINKKFFIIITKLLLELNSFSNLVHGQRVDQVINIILSAYSLIDHFEAQGLDSWLLAGASFMFPDAVTNLIKKVSLFTNMKLLDDTSFVQSFFSALQDFLNYLCKTLNLPDQISEFLTKMFAYLNIGSTHFLIKQIKDTLALSQEDNKIFLKDNYRETIKTVNAKVEKCAELSDWAKKSGGLKDLLDVWARHVKIAQSYDEADRAEPTTFIFEGPPGVMKSVIMTKLIEVLGMSRYSHIVPSVDTGKDWYDSYNNEEIFYMDDVGQEGASQWRCLLNMQSSVKMPLPCAEAKLKDSKFFNSHTLLFTTNRFTQLNLMKTDCIDNKEALWRRGMVFDFSQVSKDPLSSQLSGEVSFKHYDLQQKTFVTGFPAYFSKKSTMPSVMTLDGSADKNMKAIIIWMAAIIKKFREIKLSFRDNNSWTKDELETLRNAVTQYDELYKAQGLVSDILGLVPEIFMGELDVHFDSLVERLQGLTGIVKSKYAEYLLCLLIMMGAVILGVLLLLGRNYVCDAVRGTSWGWSNNHDRFDDDYEIELARELKQRHRTGYMEAEYRKYKQAVASGVNPEEALREYRSSIGEYVWDAQSSPFSKDFSSVHNSVKSLQNSVYICELINSEGKSVQCNGLVSGRKIILPSHIVPEDKMFIRIYQSVLENKVLVDYESVTRVYNNVERDIAIVSLPETYPSPFKNQSKWFSACEGAEKTSFLVSNEGFAPLASLEHLAYRTGYTFNFAGKEFHGELREDSITYPIQRSGLCGALVFSPHLGVLGMHVAGQTSNNIGAAVRFSPEVGKAIQECLDSDKNLLPFPILDHKSQDVSMIPLGADFHSTVPTKSNFGPSPIHGVYEIDRFPADLSKYGSETLEVVSQKSFTPCKFVPTPELNFGRAVVRSFLKPFGDLTDKQVVNGTEFLAGLNKQSSNGFNCEKDKTHYIDFKEGSPTPVMQAELEQFIQSCEHGTVEYDKLIWVETLKDEIRNQEKDGVPRSFRIGTIHQQYLKKKFFGAMVENIIQTRKFNKIMVGCNPIKDWQDIHDDLVNGKCFDGDIGKWDGNMLSQVQRAITEEILRFYTGNNRKTAEVILETLVHSLVLIKNKLCVTTHSMPSGSFLTAILNSMVNKFYTAMWYYRNVSDASVSGFWSDVSDYVYGDDKAVGVKRHHDVLNALTMAKFFESVGMHFTTSLKNKIERPFIDISEVTFLKRAFVYHNILRKIVCPLELRVIQNSLSYVDNSKDVIEVMAGKIHSVQREFYLHPNREELMLDFKQRMSRYTFKWVELENSYLQELYLDENFVTPVSFSNTESSLYF